MEFKSLVLCSTLLVSLTTWSAPVELGDYTIRDVTSQYPKNNYYDSVQECADNGGTVSAGNGTDTGGILPGIPGATVTPIGSGTGTGNTGNNIVIRPPGSDQGTGGIIGGLGGGILPSVPVTGNVVVDQILNVGSFVWALVERSRPSMYVSTYRAHGLPRGVSCWTDLEEWKIPKSKVYFVEQKSSYGQVLARFTFRISFVYGGSYNGKGQYLANVTVSPVDLKVGLGQEFASEVHIPSVFNMGTKANPKAAMQIFVYWGLGNMANARQKSSLFYVTGDGQVQLNPQN